MAGACRLDVRNLRTRNVIHIVLDAFQSDFFDELLAEERPMFDRSFPGAVFFANHTGAFPTTIASIPAMLTGKVYRNDRPLQRYVRDILKEGSIFMSLRASGYRVDAVTGMHHGKEAATNYFRVLRPYVSYDDYVQFTAWQLADSRCSGTRRTSCVRGSSTMNRGVCRRCSDQAIRAAAATMRSTAPSCSTNLPDD